MKRGNYYESEGNIYLALESDIYSLSLCIYSEIKERIGRYYILMHDRKSPICFLEGQKLLGELK